MGMEAHPFWEFCTGANRHNLEDLKISINNVNFRTRIKAIITFIYNYSFESTEEYKYITWANSLIPQMRLSGTYLSK